MASTASFDPSASQNDVFSRNRPPAMALDRPLRKPASRPARRAATSKDGAAARTPETKVIQTDVAHFRSLVQELTGTCTPPTTSAVAHPSHSSPSMQLMQDSPLPLPSDSEPSSMAPSSDTPPKAGNARLRNLAPPPIRPTPVPHEVLRRMPPHLHPHGPSSATLNAAAAQGVPSPMAISPYPRGPNGSPLNSVPGSPFSIFSPHVISPMHGLSPRGYLWGALPESPASMAMKEMALLATTHNTSNSGPHGPQETLMGSSQPSPTSSGAFAMSGVFSPSFSPSFSQHGAVAAGPYSSIIAHGFWQSPRGSSNLSPLGAGPLDTPPSLHDASPMQD